MNKIYRIVWNKARQCLLVVGENARTTVKSSGTAKNDAGFRVSPWRRALIDVLILLQVVCPPFAAAQTVIKPDGRTQTTVVNTGPVYNVSTATVTGKNAFNSFSAFSVGAGNTANLYIPSSAINLINIVRDQRTDIQGILNAIKDGRIGGNVWFANPHGFIVGASGVVNVGSLTVTTPTQKFIDDFFTAPGSPDQASVTQLLSGTAPRNSAGLISIMGRINAADGVELSAGAVNVAGSIYSGARFVGTAPDFTDVVNANGLTSATNVIVSEGRVHIVADNDVTVSGTIAAPGGAGVRGGDISIRAGGNVELNDGATVSARGNGLNSAGGTVNIWGDNNASFYKGAVIDASAGASGDGGAIELSAKNLVTIAGGQFKAGAEGGRAGSILIDPSGVSFNWNGTAFDQFITDGASYSVIASDFITLNDVYLSTRKVDAGDANRTSIDSALSTGDSGNLLLQAPTITVSGGSKLLAYADSGFTGGDITVDATRTTGGDAKISVDGSTIKGRNVTLGASSSYTSPSFLPIVIQTVRATIDINSTRVEAVGGNVAMNASTSVNASTPGFSPLGTIALDSDASVNVGGDSRIVTTGSGDARLKATSTVTSKALPGTPDFVKLPGDAGVAINIVDSKATVHLGGTSQANVGGALELAATNMVSVESKADASASGATAVGGTLALSEVNTTTKAYIDGTATTTQANSLKVAAESVNTVTTSAKAATKGAKKQTAAEKAAAASKSEETLTKYKDQASTSDGSVEVAAAVAIANVNSVTQAYVESSGTQTATGAAAITSKASNTSSVTADGSSASGAVGVGAAVGVNVGVLLNQARVADNASISSNGLTLAATMPTAGKNSFVTSATSGAGASNVGVAGALGVNVLVNKTTATLEGDKDSGGVGALVNANVGDLTVDAANTAESKLTVGASVKPATASEPAAVGVGASVGMNVVVNTATAEIEDGAKVSGVKDLDLTATTDHTITNAVTGGASGADVSVTPVAAITVTVNTTTARLGTGSQLDLLGAYTSSAEQTSSSTSTATGQTQGNNVAVGASIALNNATDTVVAAIDRDISTTGDVAVGAKSTAKSSASATASAKGGEKASAADAPPDKADGTAGKTVDEKVTVQGSAAKAAGTKTAATAPAEALAATADTASKLDTTQEAPKTEDNSQGSGGVSVAAAVGVNAAIATTTATVGKNRKITSTDGALKVTSVNQTDASAKADGSQVDSGNTSVGVGAAVALNVGISTNVAAIGENADIDTRGLTISAVNATGENSDYAAEAKSGAGAGNVGVAGSLAANVVVNTTVAALEGDSTSDGDSMGASVKANSGDILIEAANATTSTVKSGADVKGTDDTAKVGVGASIGANIGVNTTVAEVGDQAVITGGNNLGLNAKADHTFVTDVTGGAAGAKVAVTPLAAVTVAVNTTTARLGESASDIGISGAYSSKAEQNSSATTTATGQTSGSSVAVGASIGLTVATDTVTAEIERNISATDGVEVNAKSSAKSSTSATASVAGGEKAKDDGKAPAADGGSGDGDSIDKKVADQQSKATAAGKKTADKAPATPPAAGSSATTKLDNANTKQTPPKTEDTTQSGGVAVAAAVAVNTAVATTTAKVGKNRQITSGNGALKVTSTNQTDASAKADGSQVDSGNTSVGVGAAVALNVGISTNLAVVGENADIDTKGLTISAVNATGEKSDYGAEAKSGAGASNVGVAGSLAANIVVNTTVAALEGDSTSDADTKGAVVNAHGGDILIEAANATTSTVKSGADVKGTDDKAKVGVGASIGMNVGVNTVVAEAGDRSEIANGKDFGLNAKADHTFVTDVTGGAAGAKVAVTPLAAVTVAVNTTTARLGESPVETILSGKFSSTAEHQSSATTTATGQTSGSSVAVGVSIGLTAAVDTVTADVERDINAMNGVEVNAKSTAKSSTTATASVAGGDKAKDDGSAPAADGGSGSGDSVDKKVSDQQTKATDAGKTTAAKAPATTPAAGSTAGDKLDTNKQTPPKGETSEGGVSVAAAVGVNVGVATTTARVGEGRKITSSTGALKVSSINQTDTSAKADGSQIDTSGKTKVGVGAAVALNVGVATTTAVVADETDVSTKGLTVSATGVSDEKSDSSAEAKSGAGAGNVGVAGSLAINSATNTTVAQVEGNTDGDALTTKIDANGGAVLIEAQNATTSSTKVSADVKGTGDKAKVGVGASIGLNVGVNTTLAEVGDGAVLSDAGAVGLNATANHAMTTEATGGAAGAKVSVTPVVAASIAVNTTIARLGDSATKLDVNGAYSSQAEQTSTVTTKATGQAQGDVAVGASLGATIAVDNVYATVERNLDASNGIELTAKSDTSLTTEVKAGAKGAKAAKKDANGKETPEKDTTVDEQKKNQLDFAKSRNSAAASVKTDTPEAKTPDTTEKAPGTDKPTNPPNNEKQGKKVSVAAAIGATVAYNQARAEIAAGKTVGAGTGKLKVSSTTDTNYRTLATGEAVSDDVGVAAAVALTATYNKTQANIGSGVTVSDASDVEIGATSRQNRDAAFQKTMSAEAVSGASGGEVAVAGSLAAVGNYNETRASIDEGATVGTSGAPVGDVTVSADETSKISAQARAGALSTGDKSKAGVGASFAVLLSYNQNTAAVGYDANKNGSYLPTSIFADSLSVTATKNRVWFLVPTLSDAKNFIVNDIKSLNFDALDPSTYLGSNNYYTEAVAGAAAKGNAAVAGAFAVNVFGNTTEAYLGNSVNVTASGKQAAGEQLGVEVAAHSDTQAISFVGGVAGAKKAGVGLAASSIVSLDQTLATIGEDAVVKSNADGAGVKVSAYARQDIANVGVAGGIATEGVAVGGVLGAIVSLAKTEAKIGEDAEVMSKGDVDVEATGDITAVMVAGGVAGGKNVGVGASIGANVLANETRAEIGDNAKVTAKNNLTVAADADEVAVTAVVAGGISEKIAVSGAFSTNVIVGETVAMVGQGAQINTDATYGGSTQNVAITSHDDTVVVGIAGGGAGGGKAGIGAALDTTVLIKTVKAYVEDDADGLNVANINADRNVRIDASVTETLASVSMGFAGGGNAGVGGAVSIVVNKNDVQAGIGKSAKVDSEGNVLVNAQDDVVAVLTAGAGAGGGDAGVGGSLAVATLLGSTKAYVGDGATVNARGNADDAEVYVGETVIAVQSKTPVDPGNLLAKKTELAKGLSVTAYNRENLITTVVSGAGGGTAGVAATVAANVIANTTEASIGRGAKINENNAAASSEQQVRVKAIDETLLINTAGAGAGGGTAGVGAAANVGVVAKTTQAWIGRGTLVNAKQAVELDAASSALTFSTTAGFAGGGSAGVGGAVAGVGVANTTLAYIEDGTSAADAAKINVSGGDLRLNASDLATSWLVTGAGAGGGAAGVGGSLSVGVNASTTKAKIGNYAETNASGTTEVHADSTENVNTITIAGAGGGSAGVAGSISVNVVVSKTEAGIGDHAKVNQSLSGANQNVDVKATDRIITVGAAGAGAGGGAAGVGGSAVATVALNTTSAYIGSGAKVAATQDVKVAASSEKTVNSAAVAGAGGGAAGVAGAVSVIAVGSLLDGEATSGLQTQDENGNTVSTQSQADGQTTKSAVVYKDESGNNRSMLGSSAQSLETSAVLDSNAGKLAVSQHMADTATVPLKNTQAFIGYNATVKAGRDVTLTARDTTLAINANGAGAGGGAAGVAGSLGVTLLHDSAEAFIANGAKVDADRNLLVKAETGEIVVNIGVTGYGGGAAGVGGSGAVNVVTSNTSAYIGDADINQEVTTSTERSVEVKADSNSKLIAVAGSGGGAGAAAVGGVLNVNTLAKNTKAFIGEGAAVNADTNVIVSAESAQNIISAGISIQGAGAAAVGGAATVNVVANTTEAFIGSARDDNTKTAAVVDSDGNVVVAAADDTLVVAVAGSGTGAGAAAVGGAVGANVISSQTRAYVGDYTVINARGNAAGASVDSGTVGAAGAIPSLPSSVSGDIDADRDGTKDGDVSNGASFTLAGGGASTGVNPSTVKDSQGNSVGNATGGLGARGKETATGLSVTASGNQKIVSAAMGVAGAGAAGVTGTATADVIVSQTEARIGDGAQINQTGDAGSGNDVRVRAADNSLIVMASGTIAGAGVAAVSGSANAAVIAKQTQAFIGDADIKARDVAVEAAGREDVYVVTVNASVAGAAGVGAAAGVGVIANQTQAGIKSGATVDATRDIKVKAEQDSSLDIYTVSGAGGIVGVSGAFSVGVIDNTTRAYVEGGTSEATAATLDAGRKTEISAISTEEITTGTVSAAGGGVGVAGAVGVKVVTSETTAEIGDYSKVNQTRRGGATQDVQVAASDSVKLKGGSGAGGFGAFGAGATADVNVVRNTTTASIGNHAKVQADNAIDVDATSIKDVQSAAVAAAGGASAGIAGAVALAFVGASIQSDSDAKSGIGNGATAAKADEKMKADNVGSKLGSSEHVQGTKTELSSRSSTLGVSGELDDDSLTSRDKTRAFVGSNAQLVSGGKVEVSATDRTQLDLRAVGAAGGFVGLGGAVGVGITHSTTEAFVDASSTIDAVGDVTIAANALNVDANGSKVESWAGAGGVVGLSASVAVLKDTSTTQAYFGSGSRIERAKMASVKSTTARKAQADTFGATAGGLAIGASVAKANFAGSTSAYFENGVSVGRAAGKNVDQVLISASDESTATANATAGSAGIVSGAGADASATIGSAVNAHMGDNSNVIAQVDVKVSAIGKPGADAKAIGVSAGLAAVGVSLASATVSDGGDSSLDGVVAYVGEGSTVQAVLLDVSAKTVLPVGGVTARSSSSGASGGLIGANGTDSVASYDGSTKSYIGSKSTIIGSASVTAVTDSKQEASASGIAAGIVAAGANKAKASSDSDTAASLGNSVTVSGNALSVAARGTDDNYADATSGSGGVIAGAASRAETSTTGSTKASIGDGTSAKDRSIVVGDFDLSSEHTSRFNSRTDSLNASFVGVSGALAMNNVVYTVATSIGKDAVIKALAIDVASINRVRKDWLSGGQYNVNAGSGGAFNGSAANSETDITLANSVSIGSNAELEVIGDRLINPGTLRIDGFNDVMAYDRVKLDAGGAIAIARAESHIRNNSNDTSLEIGSGATLTSVGNIDLAVRSDADIQTSTNVKTYGAAGAAEGKSESRAAVNNSIDIKDHVSMLAYGDMNLRAGSDSSGNPNNFTLLANTDLWNKTAFPVETKPSADAYLSQSDTISLGTDSLLRSAGNMRLLTDKGASTVKGYGVGKDLYREVLAQIASFFSNLFGGGDVSLDIKGGSSTNLASTGVRVDGTVKVGINNKQHLYIKTDGTVDAATSSAGITVTKSNENLANSIQTRITELDTLITQVSSETGTPSTSTNPQAVAEISNLQTEKSGKNTKYAELGGFITTAQAQNDTNQQTITSNNASIQAWKDAADYKDRKAYYDGLILSAQNQNVGLQAAIDDNNNVKIPGWTTGRTDIQTRLGAIDLRIAQLQATLGSDDGGTGVAGLLQKYQAEKAMLEFQLAGLGDTSNVGVVKVDQEIVARSSNIYIKADNLTGSGALHAPGDTLIEVNNQSQNFLRTNKMTIPDEAGGRIYFNSAPVASVEAINARNVSQTAAFSNANIVTADTATPRIHVVNSYIPYGSERAPDIFVDGDIRNLNGEVEVTSSYGSVLIKDGIDVVADTIRIAAGRDVTIGYKDGFRNIGGDIKEDWATVISGSEAGGVDRTDTRTPEQIVGSVDPDNPSILAGNNVFIAGQYLNINGIVQSGIPLRTLTIPASLASEIAAYKAQYDASPTTTDRIYKGLSLNSGIDTDIRKIALFYDAKDNVLEIAPVTIMGGYMELFGHIMNTGSGELRLMDGYGTIDITNNTGYQLRLKTMNTGSGIEGTLKITDTGKKTAENTPLVTVIKRLGTEVKEFNNYSTGLINLDTAVNTTTGRDTHYDPLNNQYYSWTTLDRATWNETANYYEESWFGFTTSTQFSWGGTTAYNRQTQIPLGADVIRVAPGHTETYWYDRTQYINYSPWLTDGHWYNDVWALLYTKYHQVHNRTGSEAVLNNHNIAAFHPIKISFLGNETGQLTVNSVGGLIVDGQIKNTLGSTTLTSSGSSILQGSSEEAKVIAQHLSLNAATGIGTASSPLAIGLVNSGFVNAESSAGNVNLKEPTGSLVFGTVKAVNGDVSLSGDAGIFGWTPGSLITGKNVVLLAEHGGIGTVSAPVQVDTLDAPSGGLTATAAGNLFITEQSGDLYVVKAESLGGDVNVVAQTGGIIDNNSQQTVDTRARDKLLNLYDKMLLTGDLAKDSADQTVGAYERQKTQEYATYWKYRMRQQSAGGNPLSADAYDPDARIKLTAAERAYYATTLKWEPLEITKLEDKMTSDYHALHLAYGSVGNAYSATWKYVVERPKDVLGKTLYDSAQYNAAHYREWDTLVAGNSWTQAQLDNSIAIGALKEVSDTETRMESPNAKGRNVTLTARGAIGNDDAPVVIDITNRKWSDLSADEKVALMAAEKDDIEILSPTKVRLTQREDVDIEALGSLTVSASGKTYLGSELELNVSSINTDGGDLRLKGQRAIYSSAAGTVIRARSAIIEAGDSSIGTSLATPLVVDLSGSLTARAGDSIFIRQATGNMNVDTLYAVNSVSLDSPQSILAANATLALDIRAASLYLKAQGSAGAAGIGNALDIGLDATGELTADVGSDLYVNSPTRSLTVGWVNAGGNIFLSAEADIPSTSTSSLTVDGSISTPGTVSLASGGKTVLTNRADVNTHVGDVFLRAGALSMDDGARLRAGLGAIDIETVGDALITGIETSNGTYSAVRVVSTAGRILDNGDTRLDIIADTKPAAKLTIFGALGIGDNPLDVRLLNLQASSGGVVDIDVQNGVNIIGISAGDRVLLTAGGDITGDSVTSTGTGGTNPDQSVLITSFNGQVNLASVTGRTDVSVTGQTGVDIDTLNVGSDLQLAGPSVRARVNGGANPVTGSVTGIGGAPANSVNLILSGPGGFDFNNFIARTASVNIPLGTFSIDNAIILDRATFTNPQTRVLVDQHDKSIQRADIQLYTGGDPFSLYLKDNSLTTNSFVINRSALHEVITANGTNTSVVEQGQNELALAERSRSNNPDDEEGKLTEALVSYEGVPVSFECPSDNDPECLQ